MKRKKIYKSGIIPYKSKLKKLARDLRNNSTLSEVLLWQRLKGKQMLGYDFHRQKPLDNFIVDFFCSDLMLAIEIDGESHANKFKEDHLRQQILESYGVRFLRFNDIEIKRNINNVLKTIEGWIREYGVIDQKLIQNKESRISGTSQEVVTRPLPLSRGSYTPPAPLKR